MKSRGAAVICGNWKMYKTIEESARYIRELKPLIEGCLANIYLALPFTALYATGVLVRELRLRVALGGQNMHDATEGAFTGEISARMLVDAGARFVILGHSERRIYFHESDSFINKKVKRALADGLQPILCIGETLEQREQGNVEKILKNQILACLDGIEKEKIKKMILAYEPIWAIGTGRVAYSQDAEKAHQFCRKVIADHWGEEAAKGLVIQYGGSVKPENAKELLAQPNIDGLLVGGASLNPQSFSQIVNGFLQEKL